MPQQTQKGGTSFYIEQVDPGTQGCAGTALCAVNELGCTNQATHLMGGKKAPSLLHPDPGSAESTAQCEYGGFPKAHLCSTSPEHTQGVWKYPGSADTDDNALEPRNCSLGPPQGLGSCASQG